MSDCSDGSDEVNCYKPQRRSTISLNKKITFSIDDTSSNCNYSPNSMIDYVSKSKQRWQHCKHITSPCTRPDEIPCIAGFNRCFPLNKLCVYELDENDQLLYCPDGSHLKHCLNFNCLGMFKCYSMFGILFGMIFAVQY